jgi:hypothetical protein
VNHRRPIILLCLLLLSAAAAFSQDSLLSATRQRIEASGVLPGVLMSQFPDDSISIFDAHHFDPLTRRVPIMTRTGNLGGASFNPFEARGKVKFMDDGFNRFDPYLIDPLSNRLLMRKRRFTNVNYHLGSRKEQHIRVRHEQVIHPGFVAGLDFGAMASPGDYYRQLNNVRNFSLFSIYSSKSGSYSLYASYTSNRILNQENGGIVSDSVFEDAGGKVDTKTLPVNLDNAQITFKTRDYLLQQRFRLQKFSREADSLSTIETSGLYLTQSTWWQRRSHLFQSVSPDSGYFEHFYYDSVTTYDSSFYNDLANRLMLVYRQPLGNLTAMEIGAGASHQYVEYSSGDSTAYYSTTSFNGTGSFKAGPWTTSVDTRIAMSGDFQGSWEGSAGLDYRDTSTKIVASGRFTMADLPHYAHEQFYNSNHFRWSRDSENESRLHAIAKFSIPVKRLGTEVEWLSRKNFITWSGTDFLPVPVDKAVSLLAARVNYVFGISRFAFPVQVVAQTSSDDKIIPVPGFVFKAGFVYKNRFFKEALSLCTGADISMAASSYLHGYNPGAASFYVQQEKKTGNYPYIDVYINLGLGTAILFIKVEHLNSGFITREYYAAHHYPMTGRAFKFGVVWDLVD